MDKVKNFRYRGKEGHGGAWGKQGHADRGSNSQGVDKDSDRR